MCTRALWSENGHAVLVGRNLDWPQDLGTSLWALSPGGQRRGLRDGNGLAWAVGHASLVATCHDIATADGINDRGLGAHLLWLAESDYGDRDESVPGVAVSLWAQLFLDRFATVAECVEFIERTPLQVRPILEPGTGLAATVHLALDDATGDSAVVEHLAGERRVHHDRRTAVMTNSPPYDEQLEHLRRYQGFGGGLPLPGTNAAADRFVRASYYLRGLPPTTSWREAAAALLSVMRNAAQPFGTADEAHPNTAPTIWRTLADLTNRLYLYESSYSPYLVWVDLDQLPLQPDGPAYRLDLKTPDLAGDVTARFVPADPFEFAMPPRTALPSSSPRG